MSGDCQREMTLDEWVERLPETHRARKEYAALKAEVEKFTSTNSAMVPCPKFKVNASCDCFPNGWWCNEHPCLIQRTQHQ